MTVEWKNRLILITLIIAIGISATGVSDHVLDACGLRLLDQTNTRYLENAFDAALTGFLLLSGIKSGLAVVEGSEVGVGFSLELGDVVQPLYDYVDIAWKAALTGGSILAALQLALKGLDIVDQWPLTLMFLTLLFYFILKWRFPQKNELLRILKQVTVFLFTLSTALYLLLPLSIAGTAVLSKKITGPAISESNTKLRELGEFFTPEQLKRSFFSGIDASDLSSFDIKERLSRTGHGIKELMDYLNAATDELAGMTLKLIAAYAFDCILFPFVFGLILITMLKSGIGYIFEFKR